MCSKVIGLHVQILTIIGHANNFDLIAHQVSVAENCIRSNPAFRKLSGLKKGRHNCLITAHQLARKIALTHGEITRGKLLKAESINQFQYKSLLSKRLTGIICLANIR